MIVNILFPDADKIQLDISISEETKNVEIKTIWIGSASNPLEKTTTAMKWFE